MSARDSIENLWDRAIPIGPLLDKLEAEVRHAAAEENARLRGELHDAGKAALDTIAGLQHSLRMARRERDLAEKARDLAEAEIDGVRTQQEKQHKALRVVRKLINNGDTAAVSEILRGVGL